MKKTLSVLLALALALLPLLTFSASAEEDFGGVTLNVYNWGEYIDEQVLRDFEAKYNCRVNYKNYDSNESMYTNISGGDDPWDILVPSDYMIERLIKEDRLQPLDKSIVDNLDNLTDDVKNLSFDPDNTYSVPYLWQNVGIVFDTTKIDPATVEEKGWEIFLDPSLKGHAYMYDSSRDAFMIALKTLGFSANTDKEEEIQAAYNWLLEMNTAIKPSYVTDEMIDGMAEGFKWISLGYSGDIAYILSENEDMDFCAPKQGTNIAVDAMVIPKNAGNPKLANLFIRFVTDYDAALAISTATGYCSPNAQVMAELSGPGGEYEGNAAYLPRSGNDLDEIFHDNPSLAAKLSDLWLKVMASR
jgi:spermidine/putrescine-binding protein